MNTQTIERQFTRIGARVNVHRPAVRRWGTDPEVSIDIGSDASGEFFDLAIKPAQLAETQVIDVQPALRHLLLMSRQDSGKHKFLCGHDERHWFVAAVPERAAVSSVKSAFDALKPASVRALENRLGVKPRKRNRRRNAAFIRQGEWFFVPRVKRFTVTGVFRFGMYQFDRNLAIMHASDSARLFKMGDGFSGVRLKLSDTGRAPIVARELAREFGFDKFVSDWTQQNANYFLAVKMEKTMMFIILSMIVAVAAFNIISTLVMLVQDKQADIAILRTQGASPGSILCIFVVQGVLIGVLGTVAGLIGGIALASNIDVVVPFIENFTGPVLNPEVYYIDEMPSDLRTNDVLKVGIMSFGLSLLATIYPAWRASRVDPASALAYE